MPLRDPLLCAPIGGEGSAREGKPFVEINCSAVPESLFENELFGSLPGARSTATRRQPGKLAAAEGGTMFLDEIGDLGIAVQGKLLQFLQSREYYPLGAATPERADVRLIAATNANLAVAVREKRFREDLYYRLIVLVISVPDLEARSEGVGPLARHFCALACSKHKLPTLTLSSGAMRAIEAGEWTGNIRQLAHAIETTAIRAAVARSSSIEIRHVFADARGESTNAPLTYQQATRNKLPTPYDPQRVIVPTGYRALLKQAGGACVEYRGDDGWTTLKVFDLWKPGTCAKAHLHGVPYADSECPVFGQVDDSAANGHDTVVNSLLASQTHDGRRCPERTRHSTASNAVRARRLRRCRAAIDRGARRRPRSIA